MREYLKRARKAAGMTQQVIADKLEQLAKPLVMYLRENYNPHTTIIINGECVTVTEDVMGIPSSW